jgi:hypothetical protein
VRHKTWPEHVTAPLARRDIDMSKWAIFVLGMHRSGTSAVAGVISTLGVGMPAHLMPAHATNPKGFFESDLIMHVSDAMLAAAGSTWDDWRSLDLSRLDETCETKAMDAVVEEFGDSPFACIKDPRHCRLAPVWFAGAEQAGFAVRVLLAFRHPLEVAQSLRKRDNLGIAHALLIWLRHVVDAEYFSRGRPRSFVFMQDVLDDWRGNFERIGRELEITWPRTFEDSASEVASFLDGDLKTNTAAEVALSNAPSIEAFADAAFRAYRELLVDRDSRTAMGALDRIRTALDEAGILTGGAFEEVRQEASRAVVAANERAEANQSAAAETADLIAHLKRHLEDSENIRYGLNEALNGRNYEVIQLQAKEKATDIREAELVATLKEKDEAYQALVAAQSQMSAGFEGVQRGWAEERAVYASRIAEEQTKYEAMAADLARREEADSVAQAANRAQITEITNAAARQAETFAAEISEITIAAAHQAETFAAEISELQARHERALLAEREYRSEAAAIMVQREQDMTRQAEAFAHDMSDMQAKHESALHQERSLLAQHRLDTAADIARREQEFQNTISVIKDGYSAERVSLATHLADAKAHEDALAERIREQSHKIDQLVAAHAAEVAELRKGASGAMQRAKAAEDLLEAYRSAGRFDYIDWALNPQKRL